MGLLRNVVMMGMLFSGVFTNAQENVFLQRSYWKEKPSIEKIESDIAAGNDVTALTGAQFDAVCYALIEKADNAVVKHLLSKKGNEVDKRTHDGRTYIFWAAYKDNLEIMKYLVDHGAKANIEDSHGYSVLNFAAVTGQTNPDLYDFLLANDADINATNHDGANALLLVAPFAKDFAILQYFLDKGLAINSMDARGNGIFQYAAKGGHVPMLKTLVNQKIPYSTSNYDGENAILWGSKGTRGTQNTLATYQYLESLGIAPEQIDNKGRNALHAIAYRNEDSEVFTYFFEKGVRLDQKDEKGRTPLMNAAERNTVGAVEFLLRGAEEVDAKDAKGRTALAMAVQRNSPEVVKLLLEKGADVKTVDNDGNSLAFDLAKSFDQRHVEAFQAKLQLLQEKGLQMNQLQHEGNTLLHIAASENNLPLMRHVMKFDIEMNLPNADGNTALHLAAMSDANGEMLKYLIANGADKSIKTAFDETVYDLASENELLQGQLARLEYLK